MASHGADTSYAFFMCIWNYQQTFPTKWWDESPLITWNLLCHVQCVWYGPQIIRAICDTVDIYTKLSLGVPPMFLHLLRLAILKVSCTCAVRKMKTKIKFHRLQPSRSSRQIYKLEIKLESPWCWPAECCPHGNESTNQALDAPVYITRSQYFLSGCLRS